MIPEYMMSREEYRRYKMEMLDRDIFLDQGTLRRKNIGSSRRSRFRSRN